jgi:hypothetical protein
MLSVVNKVGVLLSVRASSAGEGLGMRESSVLPAVDLTLHNIHQTSPCPVLSVSAEQWWLYTSHGGGRPVSCVQRLCSSDGLCPGKLAYADSDGTM